jgi:2-keto-4-pentenoate hydratase
MRGVWEDVRVRRGMESQLAERGRRLAGGERHRGWKVAFNTKAAFDRLGVDASLIGFFTDVNVLDSGIAVDVSGWGAPVLECEVAAVMARDIAAGSSHEAVRDAIAYIGPGFELADFDAALMDDVSAVLAGDIFQRYMVLPGTDATRAGADASDLRGRLARGDEVHAVVEDPAAVTGDLVEVVRHTADYLDGCGAALRAGDIVMTGSMVAPIAVKPGEHWRFELEPIGEVTVSFR